MSVNDSRTEKVNNIIPDVSTITIPETFKHMSNISINITEPPSVMKIILKYDDNYNNTHEKIFRLRKVDTDKNIIIQPNEYIGQPHITLLEDNGPFVIRR